METGTIIKKEIVAELFSFQQLETLLNDHINILHQHLRCWQLLRDYVENFSASTLENTRNISITLKVEDI